jgi:glycosyltransferase involved in cell wall biosynthesis
MINDKLPLVSIGIPTYNRADSYLAESLTSAIKQTYENIEVIVSDNCSTDNTEMVVKSFNDKRIRYFRQKENIGGPNNSAFCLHQAKGFYFLQLHDDNLIDNDFIEVCLKSVNYSCDIGVIRTGVRWIDSDGNIIKELPNMASGLATDAYFRAIFSLKAPMYICSSLFNTERVREIGGFNSKHNHLEDVMAEVKIATKYGRFDIQEIKASYRKHESVRTLEAKISDWCEESIDLIDLMCHLAPKNRALIRSEGMKQYSTFNYLLVTKIKSPIKRFVSYIIVFKKYNFRYFPPTFPFRSIRHIYKKFLQYPGIHHIKNLYKSIRNN